jgi:hypothetical protein
MKMITPVLLAVCWSILTIPSAHADPPPCGKIRDCPNRGPDWHTMAEELGYDAPGQHGFHGECSVCEEWDEGSQQWVPVEPWVCHSGSCGNNFTATQAAAYAVMLASARTNDLDWVITSALEVPTHIRVDRSQRGLAILGCGGEVLLTVALGPRFGEIAAVIDRLQVKGPGAVASQAV